MLISWIKKTTLLDYPGKVATIIFTLGCNFRCHYCHNYEFVLPEKVAQFMDDLIPVEPFFNFLKTRIGFLEWVVISGWEPTVQKNLYDFIKRIKELWFLIKLDTNGRDPEIIEKLINEKLIDYIAMDIKNPFEDYYKIVNVELDIEKFKKTANILQTSGINYEFRTTIAKNIHNEEIIRKIWEDIKWAKKWYLQNYIDKNILNSAFEWKSFTEAELKELKKIGSEYVEICDIRE